MINWTPVEGSTRVVAEAYIPETETILVRFPDGVEWSYHACPPQVWEEFTAPGQSRGQYIAHVLNAKPNGRWNG
jgi:KTSC domain